MKITNIKINILQNPTSKVLARASVEFENYLLVAGFKIFRDEKKEKDFVTPPSYFNGSAWIPLIKILNKNDWSYVCSEIIDKYNQELIEESLLEDK